jgi:hypothetical protein
MKAHFFLTPSDPTVRSRNIVHHKSSYAFEWNNKIWNGYKARNESKQPDSDIRLKENVVMLN